MAWLESTPKDSDESRRKALEDQGLEPDYPLLCGADYLLECLDSIGKFRNTGNAIIGVDYSEIIAWAYGVNEPMTHWDIETLFFMSRSYANGLNAFSNSNKEAPYQAFEIDEETELKIIDNFFDSVPSR